MIHTLYVLLALCQAWAAQAVLELDTRELRVGQIVQAHLSLVDGTVRTAPDFPRVEGLAFRYEGQRQSTVMVNFKTTRTMTLQYAVTALQPGEWTIPSMTIELAGGQRAVTSPVTVTVEARDTDDSAGDQVFATLGADEAWVGQTLVYHLDFRTSKRLVDRRWTLPELDGFVAEQTSEATEREIPIVEDGRTWTRIEVDVPVVATAEGARRITPAALTAQFQVKRQNQRRQRPSLFTSSYDLKTEVFAGQLVPITVRPLPERPADFSGLVGSFELATQLSQGTVAVGESATLTVQLAGDGTLAGFALPEPPPDADYRAYDDAPEVRSEVRGGRFAAVALAKRAIVPTTPGTLTLDPIELVVFDPSLGDYVTLRSAPETLQVVGSDEQSGLVSYDAEPTSTAPAELADDILPIHPRARMASQAPELPSVLLGLGALPWLALLGIGARDLAGRRSGRVDPRADLKARAKALGPDLAAAEALFRDAVGFALDLPHGAVDRAALDRLPEAQRDPARRIYEDLDAARYGGADAGDVAARVRQLVEALC